MFLYIATPDIQTYHMFSQLYQKRTKILWATQFGHFGRRLFEIWGDSVVESKMRRDVT